MLKGQCMLLSGGRTNENMVIEDISKYIFL